MVIIGLGNPGKKYTHTRHNVGWMVLDAYLSGKEAAFDQEKMFESDIAQWNGVVFAKPNTFMNNTGIAAKKLSRHFGGTLAVVHDDIDIPLGQVKCSFGKGSGDHNGVQSIIDHLGTKDFFRIRVGVRPIHEALLPRIAPPQGFETFLLDEFSPFEKEELEQGINRAVQIIGDLKDKTVGELMNQYN